MLNLRHRHPRLWDLVVQGEVRFWQATQITQACAQAGLGLEAALWVDDRMATALGFLPWARVRNLAIEWIIEADPELARQRAERLSANRHVTVEGIRDGHCDMYGRLDAVDGILFDQALDAVADTIDPTAGDKQVRRAAAVGVLARNVFGQAQLPGNPETGQAAPDGATSDRHTHLAGDPGCSELVGGGAAPISTGDSPSAKSVNGELSDGVCGRPVDGWNPHQGAPHDGSPDPMAPRSGAVPGGMHGVRRTCELVIRLSAQDLVEPSTGLAHVERRGVLFVDRLTNLLAGCQVTVRPIIDPDTIPPTDSYRIPDDMRLVVEERNPFDVFPYGVRRARACDLDHTIPFDHHNKQGTRQTRPENLGPLSRYTHRLKTHGGWRLTQPQPGVFRWESPLGYQYLVTPSGSVRIRRPEPPPPQHWWQVEPPHEPDLPEHFPPALE